MCAIANDEKMMTGFDNETLISLQISEVRFFEEIGGRKSMASRNFIQLLSKLPRSQTH